jgi:phospholipid N-methyltransferase
MLDRFRSYYNFVNEFRKNPREIGSIVPDSRKCIDALLKHVPFDSARIILEYGSATGSVTREIVKRMNPGTSLICVEKNKYFFDRLVGEFAAQNVRVINSDASRWAPHASFGGRVCGDSVDCIISTLPCSNMDFERFIRRFVLPLLKRDGVFVQYTHIVSLLKGFALNEILGRYFASIRSDLVLLNVPPAIIYTSRLPTTILRYSPARSRALAGQASHSGDGYHSKLSLSPAGTFGGGSVFHWHNWMRGQAKYSRLCF